MVKTVILSYFDMTTKEFLQTRATVVDDSDPSVDYIPYDATEVIAPDKTTWPALTCPVFNGTGWDMVPDYRGVTFYNVLTQETKEYELGESPDFKNYTSTIPSADRTIYNSSMRAWVHTLYGHKISKRLELVKAYSAAISAPFDTRIKAIDTETRAQVSVKASITGQNAGEDSGLYSSIRNSALFYTSKNKGAVYNTADGKVVILGAGDSEKLLSSISNESTRLIKRLSELLLQLESAQTIEAVDAIVW